MAARPPGRRRERHIRPNPLAQARPILTDTIPMGCTYPLRAGPLFVWHRVAGLVPELEAPGGLPMARPKLLEHFERHPTAP